ncbi:MAG: GHMP kinase [Acidobacteriota bacterium]|nr:GHMP kinase [Acidobacteriota bacterium]
MRITAKAPCRVDMAGGTLDIWPLYLFHHNAVTVNFAIDRYTSCTLETREDSQIILRSRDLNREERFPSLEALVSAKRYRLPLLAWVVRHFAPQTGIELSTDSEAPAGAGISGSSALIIAVASALNRLTKAGHSLEKLREIAQNIEAQIIRVPTGSQDYYPAMYGGVSALELSPAGITRREIPLPPEELNSRFLLAYTGVPRNSGINNWEVMKAHIDRDRAVHRNFTRISAIANGMRTALESANWDDAGRLLREEWSLRRKNAPGISTPLIDRLIQVTRRAGAEGAKVCGAGGGGCVFFLVDCGAKASVAAAIAKEGATVLSATLSPRGVKLG